MLLYSPEIKKSMLFYLLKWWGHYSKKILFLFSEVAPNILESQNEYTVKMRYPVTLLCPVVGTPLPEISWLKNGQPLDDFRYYQTQEGSLRIASTIRDDDAIFTCVAKNTAGTSYKDIRLIVNGKGNVQMSSIEQSQVGN